MLIVVIREEEVVWGDGMHAPGGIAAIRLTQVNESIKAWQPPVKPFKCVPQEIAQVLPRNS